ncbi:hypothetical protein LTR91_024985 [Friedmanniomyces endolithicus]|uniref:Uncharacterized protein n=1 Tax=Friedmanniomyces endolithicus TaxID=329885 RepID=A0AAN6GZZ5_9PEZI|nr:hypothetical protein LTR35_017849 [Friedmanniomyces endolithicus]KAK0267795.1 hypothetical protein LTS00_017723 [Friedmanniomyces endolithicus]KAK0302237.1 hypothetical protein LTR82_017940 [Friedmanniomyces endolithicus]KAK0302370.1 hypothetical protein LTR01_008797 [Friedmanniomyces endolithicus]KAK0823037.1 hypothetical protein LTR73_008829 [Friedmanniomyces endolithicus]
MTSPSDSFIDALAARATIEKDDEIGFISIPGIEAVPESQRIAIFKKAEQRLVSSRLDADALRSRLQSITPPPLFGEERDEESRLLEAQARQDLESEGCAPCYPAHLKVPVRHPPEEYRLIIEYWQSLGVTDDVVLCAQRSDWRKFRHYQRLQRRYYRKKPFGFLEEEVRERRQRNGLDDDVRLLPDPRQQNRQQDWIEFQDFHLEFWERKTKDRQELRDRLEEARRIASDRGAEGSGGAAWDVTGIPQILEYADSILRWHDVFLQWIERQREAMEPHPSTPVEQSSGDQETSASRPRDEPSKSPAEVVEFSNSTAQSTEPVPEDIALAFPNTARQIPKRRKSNPRRTKEKALAQFSPPRVAKASGSAGSRTKPRAGTQRSGARQNRVQAKHQRSPSTERPLPARRSITTRSAGIEGATEMGPKVKDAWIFQDNNTNKRTRSDVRP